MDWKKPEFKENLPITVKQMNDLSDGIDNLITGVFPAVTSVTQEPDNNSNKIATTAYVDKAINDIKNTLIAEWNIFGEKLYRGTGTFNLSSIASGTPRIIAVFSKNGQTFRVKGNIGDDPPISSATYIIGRLLWDNYAGTSLEVYGGTTYVINNTSMIVEGDGCEYAVFRK